MADKLYLLTEAELRGRLEQSIRMADNYGDANAVVESIIADIKPLSPDWSKAPEWAKRARFEGVWTFAEIDEMPDCVSCEEEIIGDWIPRPYDGGDQCEKE